MWDKNQSNEEYILNGTEISWPWKVSRKSRRKLLNIHKGNHLAENVGNSERKAKWNGNFLVTNLISRKVVLFSGNSRKCCFFVTGNLRELKSGLFIERAAPFFITEGYYLMFSLKYRNAFLTFSSLTPNKEKKWREFFNTWCFRCSNKGS